MTIVRHRDCPPVNDQMIRVGYAICAIEHYRWPDGHTETEILWVKDEPPIQPAELPF